MQRRSNQQRLSPIELAFAKTITETRDVFCRSETYQDKHRTTRFGYSNQDPNDQ